jgi:hypothetical protein
VTDRIKAYVVTLEADVREDDAEAITGALKCIRGVLSVKPVVADISGHIAEERARQELGEKLWAVLYPKRV